MNDLPKVVFSKTLENTEWGRPRAARVDLAEEISALKREPGGDIIAHGGASFVQALPRAGQVDQYRLVINRVGLIQMVAVVPGPRARTQPFHRGAGAPGIAYRGQRHAPLLGAGECAPGIA